ncbi:MAG: histidinol dehydrogenase [Chitinophagaceae bacterium]|nr:histidinol dehydrogenase [Chitinophagaceae bacterium]
MKSYRYPAREEWNEILKRPVFDTSVLNKSVQKILLSVKTKGDKAVRKYTKQFDGVALRNSEVSAAEFDAAREIVSPELKKAIEQAVKNIRLFHQQQLSEPEIIETMPGVQCWRKMIAIEKVGLYIPGGSAPLFSTVLMLGIPAVLAGCKQLILCTPPGKEGTVNPAILVAAEIVGIKKIFKVGGVQAIAAMAFGTESIPSVSKIFGPGNQYVTAAKQLVQQYGIAIDMPAGPSEVAVLADDSCNPRYVAADLLSQAEHGADSQVLLVTTSQDALSRVQEAIDQQLNQLSRKEIATKALENSKAILVNNLDEAIDLLNEYAAEHLIISCDGADSIADRIINAGSVFIGNYSPESVGDYASGTNHTLPTNGYAKAYSGVSVDSFTRKITFQKLSSTGLQNIAETVQRMAEAEGLDAHAHAVKIRILDL